MVQQYVVKSNFSVLNLTPDNAQATAAAPANPRPFSTRDSHARLNRNGRPGSRRYQRYLNSSFLQEHQWDLKAEDFEVVRPISVSPFTQLFEEENARRWAPFVDVTEERQEELLCRLSSALESDIEDEFGEFVFINSKEEEEEEVKVPSYPPKVLFGRVNKRIRKAMVKNASSEFLASLERDLVDYIKLASSKPITFKFEQSFHRLLCHGVCQYYSLNSRSQDTAGARVVVVYKPKAGVLSPSVLLTEFLRTIES